MPKHLLAILLMAAAANASAEAYDPCVAFRNQVNEISQARDTGVLMSKFLISKAGRFDSDKEQEDYFRMAATIFLNPAETAAELEAAAVSGCNG